mmetsp:Transcript_3721/g.7113  ORF Transcript_3721/g.7113 Transcript_3721/m.7113 type:complete len:144 (+) Transcript_3721:243-674(+)
MRRLGGISSILRRYLVRSPENWSEVDFSRTAESVLEQIGDAVSDQQSLGQGPSDLDVEFSQGVLTLQLGEQHGTYVLNTQTPNRQIWLSSPVSGPWRYHWDDEVGQWRSTRDDHELVWRLADELKTLCNITLEIPSKGNDRRW